MKAKVDRNKQILHWYFVDDLSIYDISLKIRLTAPVVWRIIKRDALKYGYANE